MDASFNETFPNLAIACSLFSYSEASHNEDSCYYSFEAAVGNNFQNT